MAAAARDRRRSCAEDELREDYIIPSVFNRDVAPAVADGGVERPRARPAWPTAARRDRLRRATDASALAAIR